MYIDMINWSFDAIYKYWKSKSLWSGHSILSHDDNHIKTSFLMTWPHKEVIIFMI